MSQWFSINDAPRPTLGTVADLKLANGRIYRAVFERRGRVYAWWPQSKARKRPIGTADYVAIRVVAHGIVSDQFHDRGKFRAA